jgi:hypothetical protein
MKRNKQYKKKQALMSYVLTMKRNRKKAFIEWAKNLYLESIRNENTKT